MRGIAYEHDEEWSRHEKRNNLRVACRLHGPTLFLQTNFSLFPVRLLSCPELILGIYGDPNWLVSSFCLSQPAATCACLRTWRRLVLLRSLADGVSETSWRGEQGEHNTAKKIPVPFLQLQQRLLQKPTAPQARAHGRPPLPVFRCRKSFSCKDYLGGREDVHITLRRGGLRLSFLQFWTVTTPCVCCSMLIVLIFEEKECWRFEIPLHCWVVKYLKLVSKCNTSFWARDFSHGEVFWNELLDGLCRDLRAFFCLFSMWARCSMKWEMQKETAISILLLMATIPKCGQICYP